VETYTGRLVADGQGNLLADEGPRAGEPVAFDEGQYIFVAPGEPSHNERHHQQFVEATGTVDESMTDDPELVNANENENTHHFGVLEEDPHHDGVKYDDDRIAAKITGHTEAYRG
jgi:hypothetical protein